MTSFFRRIPRQVALGALLLYGLTVSHGVTLDNLPLTAKIAGWDEMPMVGQPLLWLLTLPFGILFLLFSVTSLFLSDLGLSIRTAGFALWFLYPSALAAERIRVWPFNRLAVNELD